MPIKPRFWVPALASLMLVACASQPTEPQSDLAASPLETTEPTSVIQSASFVTHNLEASVDFYVNFLGYKLLGTSTIDAEKSRQVVGALQPGEVRYASLAPAEWDAEAPSFSGVSFIEIPWAAGRGQVNDPQRPSRASELILAHRVTNIVEIEKRMRAADVPFVADLGPSGSGNSQSMAVLDPNGVRVEMYEY